MYLFLLAKFSLNKNCEKAGNKKPRQLVEAYIQYYNSNAITSPDRSLYGTTNYYLKYFLSLRCEYEKQYSNFKILFLVINITAL
jgi:hypothetical protein